MARVLITNGVPMEGIPRIQGIQIDYPGEGKGFSKAEILELLPEADAVLACSKLDENLISAGKRLKLIVAYGAGYDSIDVEAATRMGIPVANIPDEVTEDTAGLAMAMMLCLSRRICELNHLMHQPDNAGAFGLGKHMGLSLKGAILGIVGMGRIGARVADFGRFAGMKVIYTSHGPKPEQDALGASWRALKDLMKEADYVSVHVPYTSETDGLITRELLLTMKPTAFLINVARGRVIDEEALVEMLMQKRIAGAGLDVFCDEPHIHPAFATLSNALLTPHVGSNTVQARRNMAMAAWERITDVLEGRKPKNLLNPQVWKAV